MQWRSKVNSNNNNNSDYLENLLNVYGVRSRAENERSLHGLGELASLLGDFGLLVIWKSRVEVVLGANQEGRGALVKQTRLLVPVLDTRQCGFAL